MTSEGSIISTSARTPRTRVFCTPPVTMLRPQESVVAAVAVLAALSLGFEFKHHDNIELFQVLQEVETRCPRVARAYQIGQSARGQWLYGIEFSSCPGHHQLLKPEFRFAGNIHGNEVLGRELLLKLADYLCERYEARDPEIRRLIKTTRIHLWPSVNPDGWDVAAQYGNGDQLTGRSNNNSVDLNRNFPDLNSILYEHEEFDNKVNNHLLEYVTRLDERLEPETKSIIKTSLAIPFVLSAMMHGGDLVINYPYDASRTGQSGVYAKSPDDKTFIYLARAYASLHEDMADPSRAACSIGDIPFAQKGGITNGADWYNVKGGVQDFMYLGTNDMELTMELGCKKFPPTEDLPIEWKRNRDALINFMWQVHIGFKGIVYDAYTKIGIPNAIIRIANVTSGRDDPQEIRHDITTNIKGDYYRLIIPGVYLVTIVHKDYTPQSRYVTVTNPSYSQALRQDFALQPVIRQVYNPQAASERFNGWIQIQKPIEVQ